MADTNLEQLKRVLDELFMLDRADLVFRLHSIMNARRDEIRRFLDGDSLPKVRAALGEMAESDHRATEEAQREARKQASALGVDPSTVPRVRELPTKKIEMEDGHGAGA